MQTTPGMDIDRTILVADDEPEVRGYLAMALRCHGFQAEFAEDGRIQDVPKRGAISQIAVMKREIDPTNMGIVIKWIDAVRVEKARPAHNAVDFVSFSSRKKLGEIGPVLTRDAGDQCSLHDNFQRSMIELGARFACEPRRYRIIILPLSGNRFVKAAGGSVAGCRTSGQGPLI